MSLFLPLFSDSPHFSYQVDLDATTYGFEFKWNARDASWYFNLADADGLPLLSGLRVVVRHLYLSRYRYFGLPIGELEFVDSTDKDLEPGLEDLGQRVFFIYTPAAELPPEYVT